jgi:hypothetical protein
MARRRPGKLGRLQSGDELVQARVAFALAWEAVALQNLIAKAKAWHARRTKKRNTQKGDCVKARNFFLTRVVILYFLSYMDHAATFDISSTTPTHSSTP